MTNYDLLIISSILQRFDKVGERRGNRRGDKVQESLGNRWGDKVEETGILIKG